MSSIHGSCVAFGMLGVLIRGEPGAGKSSLCLRLIDGEGYGLGTKLMRCRLVADDQVVIWNKGKRLMGCAPPELEGLIEVRGLGILQTDAKRRININLVVDLKPAAAIERLPDQAEGETEILGVTLPRIYLDGHAASAPAVLRAAISNLGRKTVARAHRKRRTA